MPKNNARARSGARSSCAARTRKPAQEVKVLGFCSLPARTFETQEVENLAARSRKKLLMLPQAARIWRVIRVKIQCTNFFQFEFRNKSFCVQLLSNCSSFSSLNFETSLFAYNYFLIAALTACLIVNEVYLGITC